MQDLNDLRFFATVVAQQSFSAAARALSVPKSRISRRVAALEEQLGVRLLERSTRRVSVTDAGKQVYEHARAAMLEAEAVDEVALRLKAEPRGLVRISCPLGLQRALSDPLPAFLADNPMLRVQLVMTNRRVDLIEESIDIAVRVRERLDTDGDLQMKRVGTSKRILVAAPALLERFGTPHTPADLQSLPLLDQQEHPGPHRWTLTNAEGDEASIDVVPRLATGDLATLVHAARAGLGVALVPRANCEVELAAGELVQTLPGWGIADGILHLIFTSRRGMLPGVRAVIDFAAQALSVAVS